MYISDEDLATLTLPEVHAKYGEVAVLAAVKRLSRGMPIFKDSKRRQLGDGFRTDIERAVAVERVRAEHPKWKDGAIYDAVGADHGVGRDAIRRSYERAAAGLVGSAAEAEEKPDLVRAILHSQLFAGIKTNPTDEERAAHEAAAKKRS
jgi:hypothetical protein